MGKNNERVAIITGSANGIGKSIAEKFIQQNIKVILVDIDKKNLNKTVSEIDPLMENTESFEADVSSEKDLEALKSIVKDKFGYLDILVNNAGIAPNRLLEDQNLDEWEKVIKVNLTGTFLCSKMAVGKYFDGDGSDKDPETKIPRKGFVGNWTFYYKSGQQWQEGSWKDGVPTGEHVKWYPNGNTKTIQNDARSREDC